MVTLSPSPLVLAGDDPADRRAHPRIVSGKLPLTNARITNRGSVSLVDLSAGGALIILPFQVRPESRFALQLETAADRVQLPFLPLRCYVASLEGGSVTYHAAGTFDSPLNLQALSQRASSAAQRLIATIERLRDGLKRAAAQSKIDAAFSDMLGAVIAWLRRGDSIDLVTLKVKAQLTHQYPSLRILSSMMPDDLTAVGGFGLTLRSKHRLSSHDRRYLRAHAQLLSLLEDARRAMDSEVAPRPVPASDLIISPAQWMTAHAAAGFAN